MDDLGVSIIVLVAEVDVGGTLEFKASEDASSGSLEGPATDEGEGIAQGSLSESFCFGSCRHTRPVCILPSDLSGSTLVLSAALPHRDTAGIDFEDEPKVDM